MPASRLQRIRLHYVSAVKGTPYNTCCFCASTPPYKPRFLDCKAHIACSGCIDDKLAAVSKVKHEDGSQEDIKLPLYCQYDEQALSAITTPPNEYLLRMLYDKQALWCPYECEAQLSYNQIDDHIKSTCENRLIKCPLRCKAVVRAKDVVSHLDNECQKRVPCLDTDHPDGCAEKIKRCQLAAHRRDTCENTVIACTKSQYGCKLHFPRKLTQEHMQSAWHVHNQNYEIKISELEALCEIKNTELAATLSTIEDYKRSIGMLEQKLESPAPRKSFARRSTGSRIAAVDRPKTSKKPLVGSAQVADTSRGSNVALVSTEQESVVAAVSPINGDNDDDDDGNSTIGSAVSANSGASSSSLSFKAVSSLSSKGAMRSPMEEDDDDDNDVNADDTSVRSSESDGDESDANGKLEEAKVNRKGGDADVPLLDNGATDNDDDDSDGGEKETKSKTVAATVAGNGTSALTTGKKRSRSDKSKEQKSASAEGTDDATKSNTDTTAEGGESKGAGNGDDDDDVVIVVSQDGSAAANEDGMKRRRIDDVASSSSSSDDIANGNKVSVATLSSSPSPLLSLDTAVGSSLPGIVPLVPDTKYVQENLAIYAGVGAGSTGYGKVFMVNIASCVTSTRNVVRHDDKHYGDAAYCMARTQLVSSGGFATVGAGSTSINVETGVINVDTDEADQTVSAAVRALSLADTKESKQYSLPSMREQRHFHALVFVPTSATPASSSSSDIVGDVHCDGTLFAIGGLAKVRNGPLASVERLNMTREGLVRGWIQDVPLPLPVSKHLAVAHRGVLYVLAQNEKKFWSYDTTVKESRWVELPMPRDIDDKNASVSAPSSPSSSSSASSSSLAASPMALVSDSKSNALHFFGVRVSSQTFDVAKRAWALAHIAPVPPPDTAVFSADSGTFEAACVNGRIVLLWRGLTRKQNMVVNCVFTTAVADGHWKKESWKLQN